MPYLRNTLRPLALLLALLPLGAVAATSETMAFPTPDKPSFLIDYPSGWTLTPGEQAGDYAELAGPTGAIISVRTIEGSEGAMEAAIEDTTAYVTETYENVQISEPKENQGPIQGSFATGTGDSEDGKLMFQFGWYVCNDGSIAEVWYELLADDAEGLEQARRILGSFRLP